MASAAGRNTAKAGIIEYVEPSRHLCRRRQRVCIKLDRTSEVDVSVYCSGLSLLAEKREKQADPPEPRALLLIDF
jgi:hypothetical protein